METTVEESGDGANRPEEGEKENSGTTADASSAGAGAQQRKKEASKGASSYDFFKSWAGSTTGMKYYDGGFLEKMTRREAAQILGTRESASAERIKEAHRRILMANHPDKGGSAFLATKINEAKEMLVKGK